MRILASANQAVMAQYALLESAVEADLDSKPNIIEDRAHKYVRQRLERLAPGVALPDDAQHIDEKSVVGVLERFSQGVNLDGSGTNVGKQILPAGDVAFTFSCLAFYAVGITTNTLSGLQHKLLLGACDIAERTPLPVMRWTHFVRSNITDVARVRTVMRACVYSKTVLNTRISNAFAELSDHLGLSEKARILAIGSSGTVCFALEGLTRDRRELTVRPTLLTSGVATPYGELDANIEPVDDAESSAIVRAHGVDLVVLGCAIIGKTKENEFEVVNWAREIDLAKEANRCGIRVVVIGALHKIWPQSFYEARKNSVLRSQKSSLRGHDAILTQNNMDWLVTEQRAVNFSDPDRPPWVPFMLGAKSLDVAATLSMCKNKKDLIQHVQKNEDLYRIDETLGRLRGAELSAFERFKISFGRFIKRYLEDQKGAIGRGPDVANYPHDSREPPSHEGLRRALATSDLVPGSQISEKSIILNKCAKWTLLLFSTMTVSLLIVLAINLPIWAEVIFCLLGATASAGLIASGSVARAVSS